jgi:hypothetical protein
LNFDNAAHDRYFRPWAAAIEKKLDAGETKETKEGKGAKEDEGKDGKEVKESKSPEEQLEDIATAVAGDGTGSDRPQFIPRTVSASPRSTTSSRTLHLPTTCSSAPSAS